MNMMTFYEKVTNKCFNHSISLSAQKVFKINLDVEEVYKFFKCGNTLKIILINGKEIMIEDFFELTQSNQLIFETMQGGYFLVNLTNTSEESGMNEVQLVKVDDLNDLAKNGSSMGSSILKWLTRSNVGIGGSQRLSVFNLINS